MKEFMNGKEEPKDPIIEKFIEAKEWAPLLAYIKEGKKKPEDMSNYTLRAYWLALKGLPNKTPKDMEERIKVTRLLCEREGKEEYYHDLFEARADMTEEEVRKLFFLYVNNKKPDELEEFSMYLIDNGKSHLVNINLLEELIKKKVKMAPLTICRYIIENVKDNDELRWQALRLYRKYAASTEKTKEVVIKFYKEKFGNLPHFNYFLEKANIEKVGVTEGGNRFEKYIKFEEGNYLRDNKADVWIVKRIDPITDMMTIERNDGVVRSIEFVESVKIFYPLDKDDFRVYSTHRIEEFMKFSPVEMVEILLKSYNKVMKTHEISSFLKPIIGQKKWNSFWRQFKKQVEEEGHVEIIGKGRQPSYRYNPSIVRVKEEKSKLSLVDLINEMKKKKNIDKLKDEWLEKGEKGVFGDIGLYLLGEDVSITEKPEDRILIKLVSIIKETDFVPLLSLVYEWLDEKTLVELLLETGDNIRNFMLKKKLYDVIYAGMKKAFIQKMKYPRAFFWLSKLIIDKKIETPEGMTRSSALSALLSFLDYDVKKLPNAMDVRNIKTRVKQYLINNNYAVIFDVLSELSPKMREVISSSIENNRSLPVHRKREIVKFIQQEFSDDYEMTSSNNDIIYSSKGSIDRYRSRLKEIKEKEIPENTEEISRAAAHGDLSENAEYKYARQKQEKLISEAQRIEDMLMKVRPFPEFKEGTVSPGSVVKMVDKEGNEEVVTIGGVWDVDIDNNIFSYQSAIGETLLGKKVGDEVEMPDGKIITIKEVEKWGED